MIIASGGLVRRLDISTFSWFLKVAFVCNLISPFSSNNAGGVAESPYVRIVCMLKLRDCWSLRTIVYISSVSYTGVPAIPTALLEAAMVFSVPWKVSGHPDSKSLICSLPISNDLSTLTVFGDINPLATLTISLGWFLGPMGSMNEANVFLSFALSNASLCIRAMDCSLWVVISLVPGPSFIDERSARSWLHTWRLSAHVMTDCRAIHRICGCIHIIFTHECFVAVKVVLGISCAYIWYCHTKTYSNFICLMIFAMITGFLYIIFKAISCSTLDYFLPPRGITGIRAPRNTKFATEKTVFFEREGCYIRSAGLVWGVAFVTSDSVTLLFWKKSFDMMWWSICRYTVFMACDGYQTDQSIS